MKKLYHYIKKRDTHEISNYGPVSLLSCVSKVFLCNGITSSFYRLGKVFVERGMFKSFVKVLVKLSAENCNIWWLILSCPDALPSLMKFIV